MVQRQAVATVASQKGLEVEQVRGRDPRLLEEGAELSAAQIPLHFLFRSTHGHIVQVFFLFPTSLILFVYMKSEFFNFFGLLA